MKLAAVYLYVSILDVVYSQYCSFEAKVSTQLSAKKKILRSLSTVMVMFVFNVCLYLCPFLLIVCLYLLYLCLSLSVCLSGCKCVCLSSVLCLSVYMYVFISVRLLVNVNGNQICNSQRTS